MRQVARSRRWAQLTARAQQQQRDLLDAAMQSPQGNVQQLLGDFWASGPDEAAVERDGANPVAPLLKRIDGIRKTGDVAPAIAALHQVGIPVLFNFTADVDLSQLDRHLGYFSQGGLGLPDPAYYTRSDADTQALVARYADYIRKVLTLTGIQAKDLERETALVLDLEKRIAASARPLVELRDPKANFAPVATSGLGKQYRNLQLDAFLKTQGVSDDTVSIANPAMFAQLDALVGGVKPAQWKSYLRWRVGDAMAPYLAKPWRDATHEFRGKVLRGDTRRARWQQVLDAINHAAGRAWPRVRGALPADATKHAVAIAGRCAMRWSHIGNSTWMSAAARRKRQQAWQLRIEVGTPRRDLITP